MATRTLGLAAFLVVRVMSTVDFIEVDIALACATWEDGSDSSGSMCRNLISHEDAPYVAVQAIECNKLDTFLPTNCQCRCFTQIDWECGEERDTAVLFQAVPQRVLGQTGGKCLDSGGDLQNGDELFVWDCAGSSMEHPNQMWTFLNGHITAVSPLGGSAGSWEHQKCMDVPNGDISKGAQLQVWDCLDLPQQQFSHDDETGLLHVPGTDLCVDSPGGGFNNADAIWLWDCEGSQAWDFVSTNQFLLPTAVI